MASKKKAVAFAVSEDSAPVAEAPVASAGAGSAAPVKEEKVFVPGEGLKVQDLSKLDAKTLTPLTPEIISRQVSSSFRAVPKG
jgi:hypothetical protein